MGDGGTYTLVVGLADTTTVAFGARGAHDLAPGWYAYTGSARGAGGFARVERHRELAAGERETRHWHVDYLLGHPATDLATVVTTADADVECAVGRRLAAAFEPVGGLGASDCDCRTHLVYAGAGDRPDEVVERAHRAASGAEPARR